MAERQHDLQRKRQQCEVRTVPSVAMNRPHTRILTLHFCNYQGSVRTLGNCVHLASPIDCQAERGGVPFVSRTGAHLYLNRAFSVNLAGRHALGRSK
jgi:hypothetical protein